MSVLFTFFLWWASTGAIIAICALPERTFKWSLAAGSLLLAAGLYGLSATARRLDETAAYGAFLSAIAVWGWLEMGFLMGYVTGPNKTPCPPDERGWPRFSAALRTVLYHELAIAAAALLVVWCTWGAPNQTGTWAFLILMVMRISAKLNIFLGVPNLTDVFLPQRLAYLKSYFRKRRLNLLFPVSMIGSGIVAYELARLALGAEGGIAVGAMLLFTLLALAVLEHLFMILPIRDAVLWMWALPSGNAAGKERAMPAEKSVP